MLQGCRSRKKRGPLVNVNVTCCCPPTSRGEPGLSVQFAGFKSGVSCKEKPVEGLGQASSVLVGVCIMANDGATMTAAV